MFDHISIGVRNVAAARRFYDAAFTALGIERLSANDRSLSYGTQEAVFLVDQVERPVPSDDGSGLHFCFRAPSRAAVDKFHAAALEAGGRDNGKPGLRPDYSATYYSAFVVDPDGYRIEAYCGQAA